MRKRTVWFLGAGCAVVCGVVACTTVGGGARAAAAADPQLVETLRADVRALAGDIGPRAVFRDDTLARAARWVTRRFESQGWTVARQACDVGGVECANLIVERRGTTFPDEIVIVGAHYDTVPVTPGADDNASGVAALLALSARFAGGKPARTLRFVAFANEEPVYFQTERMGSRVYAKACKERGERVVAMLALETMGYYRDEKGSQKYPFPLSLFYPARGDFLAVVGNRPSQPLVARVTKLLRTTRTIPVEAAALPDVLPGIGWSDHWAFWQEGYPAVMLTDTAPFRNPHYHRATDTPETLDYARLAAATQGLERVVGELAGCTP